MMVTMLINIINGDLLKAKEDIICHQVNCQGVMGGGIAKQIKNKYPEVYREYLEIVKNPESKKHLLGHASFTKTNDNKIIFNLFGQYNYGTEKRQTNYEALYNAMEMMFTYAQCCEYQIALPYNIGCGLGGGNWDIVYTMIEELSKKYNIYVTIYKKEK